MKIAILGAGISGLSLFDILRKEYGIEAAIYEAESTVGGLCRTRITNGYVFDISGGHVYNSRYGRVNNYVFELLNKNDWIKSQRKSKIEFNGKMLNYPFEFSLFMLEPRLAADCINDLYNVNKIEEIQNLEDFFTAKFGKRIVDLYMGPYNEKIWKRSLKALDFDWVDGKMPNPDPYEILLKTLQRENSETQMVHSSYFYPRKGGIQTLIDRMSEGVPKEHMGESMQSIEFIDKSVYVNGERYDLAVWTIPLKYLTSSIKNLSSSVIGAIEELQYNRLLTMLFSCEKMNDYSWTYIPDDGFIPHRIVYQGNLSPDCCPEDSSMTFEVTRPELFDMDEIIKQAKSRYPVNEMIDYNFTEYAYVVFDKKRSRNLELISHNFEGKPILFHGRFAQWEYPNIDICINNSFNLAEKISKMDGKYML